MDCNTLMCQLRLHNPSLSFSNGNQFCLMRRQDLQRTDCRVNSAFDILILRHKHLERAYTPHRDKLSLTSSSTSWNLRNPSSRRNYGRGSGRRASWWLKYAFTGKSTDVLGITSCTRVAAFDSSRSTAASIVIVGDMTRRRNVGGRLNMHNNWLNLLKSERRIIGLERNRKNGRYIHWKNSILSREIEKRPSEEPNSFEFLEGKPIISWVFTVHTQKASALLFGFHDFTVVCKKA